MRPACMKAMLLAERSASGLDDADRILLEAHLAECASCAAQTTSLEGLAHALREADWSLKPRARDSVLDRALRAAPISRSAAPERRRPRVRVWLPVAAALAAVFGAVVWLVQPRDPARISHAAAPHAIAQRVPRAAPAPSALSADPAPCAEASSGSRLELGRAKVEVLRAARVCWRADASTLELDRGAVRVDVQRVEGRVFRVVTKRFAVEVLGTVFDVDSDRVSVTRGSVRIVAPPTGKQVALLEAGQSWSSQPQKPALSAVVPSVERILLARRDLAEGRIKAARARLRELLLEPLDARRRAEVESLLAECSLAEHDFDAAASAFGRVAREHGASLAGETALFAQARAELRGGRRAAARKTLQGYLARYPNGRFRKEALDHLRKLMETP